MGTGGWLVRGMELQMTLVVRVLWVSQMYQHAFSSVATCLS